LEERFRVSWDYVKKIRKQQLRFGQMERVRQARHGPARWMTAAVERELRTQLRAQPDLTLWALQQWLRKQTGMPWSKSLVWLCLQRLELRRKKHCTPLSKTRRRAGNDARRGGSRSVRSIPDNWSFLTRAV
jgi:transposase